MIQSNSLAKQVRELMPAAGISSTDIANLALIRSDEVTQSRVAVMYEPCIYIVAQGQKSATLGSEDYIYNALNYLVLSVPLPLECQILEASMEQPYLAIQVKIDTQLLNQLIQELPDLKPKPKPKPNSKSEHDSAVNRGIFVSQLGEDIKSTLTRLLSYVNQPGKAKVLGSMAIKELLFHVLQGAQGELLRAFGYRDKQSFQIAKVLNFIQSHYSQNIEVAELASKANMSQSSFHFYFKAITSASPIQYIKTIRLHAARRNMLFDHQSASDAAYKVGYASPSQFSREYRRLFGVSPSIDNLNSG